MCLVVDSNGYFDQLWELSSQFVQKDFSIIAVGTGEKFIDGDIPKMPHNTQCIAVRAVCKGKPKQITCKQNNTYYKALQIGDKIYVPRQKHHILVSFIHKALIPYGFGAFYAWFNARQYFII